MVAAVGSHYVLRAQNGERALTLTFHFGRLERVLFEMEPGGLSGMVNTDDTDRDAFARVLTSQAAAKRE